MSSSAPGDPKSNRTLLIVLASAASLLFVCCGACGLLGLIGSNQQARVSDPTNKRTETPEKPPEKKDEHKQEPKTDNRQEEAIPQPVAPPKQATPTANGGQLKVRIDTAGEKTGLIPSTTSRFRRSTRSRPSRAWAWKSASTT